MLSAQVDELRSMAESVGLAMPQAATLMMEAADTIWELRGSVHRERAEADRLREQIHWLKKGDILHVLTDQEYFNQCERERLMQVSIDALDKDNAKLRELARAAWRCIHTGASCSDCRLIAGGCTLQTAMRELGIEVDK